MMNKINKLLTLHSFTSMSIISILPLFFIGLVSPPDSVIATPTTTFIPKDNFYIACGSEESVFNLEKEFQSDPDTERLLQAQDKYLIYDVNLNEVPALIYRTARVFKKEAMYTFPLQDSGWHYIRLHFFPFENNVFNLKSTAFSVMTDQVTLLHDYIPKNLTMKEYLINIDTQNFSITFLPEENSAAYINAIEVATAPENLINDTTQSLDWQTVYSGVTTFSFQTVYRVNVGGSLITSENDTLGRTWTSDEDFLKTREIAKSVKVQTSAIKYRKEVTPFIAPQTVYATAVEMADSNETQQFNITWEFDVDTSYFHFVRFHFCDIVSKVLDELYFNVYINGKKAISDFDLSKITNQLATPNYHDIIINRPLMKDKLTIQIQPTQDSRLKNAILNGLEVFKMNNSASSLDGNYRPVESTDLDSGSVGVSHKQAVVAVGCAMMFGAFVGLGAMAIKCKKRREGWERKNSVPSWLLPVQTGDSTDGGGKSRDGSSHRSVFTGGIGRSFMFNEIKECTKNFDASSIIGVGGFGSVYLGLLYGNQVAVKRGNPQSEQGINEFKTEILMLSKLRHKHLVSLIGYCDQNNEMILVYEYMSNGAFRDHLYGTNLSPLSWKQRLEICIGAARGLHYLHTGSTQGIIHRDVKTTNILLDDDFIAKMADFGLSKDGPGQQAKHVSTAVKGSFGYLDPEYFRRRQLTEKSDVFSFGVVLFEALCARPVISPTLPREQVNLAEWAMQSSKKGNLDKIIDPVLVGTIHPESLKTFAKAAEKCLSEYGSDRPTMSDVLWNLEYALRLQEAKSQGKSDNPPLVKPSPAEGAGPNPTIEQQPSPIILPQVNQGLERSGSGIISPFNNLIGR